MIGRFDSTGDRRRAVRMASTLLLAALGFAPLGPWAGLRAQGQAAAPGMSQSPRKPKATIQGVTASPPAAQARPVGPEPLEPGGAPDFSQPPPSPMPAGDAPKAGGIGFPKAAGARPTLDPNVIPADGPGPAPDVADPHLPPAKEAPGGGGGGGGRGAGDEPDSFALPADRLPLGKQRVQLSVEVQASQVLNLGKESTVKLIVLNESGADAFGVSVVYQLPDGLEMVSFPPEGAQDPVNKSLYVFRRRSALSANGEWAIVLKVVARSVKPCEHSATVTAKAGSRASTTVQEPKLKVEVTVSPSRILKGKQVKYEIAVTNPGSGPARNVVVQAKLSSGLKLGSDDIVEQMIKTLRVGERVELDPLIVDAIAGGQQSCTVDVQSPDVTAVVADHRVVRAVEVTRPELKVQIAGPDFRYTGQSCEYKATITNEGTAPAQNVVVVATLPSAGGRLMPPLPAGATFEKSSRKLKWKFDQIEPKQQVDVSFLYATSTQGLYRVAVEATSGELRAPIAQMSTDVSGMAVLDLQITQDKANRVIDVGQTTYYDIHIKNTGTKEATGLQLSGQLTNFTVLQQFGLEKGEVSFKPETGNIVFPLIDRLDPGKEIVLSLELKPKQAGPAKANISLAHAEQGDEGKVEDVIATTVTGSGRPRPAGR